MIERPVAPGRGGAGEIKRAQPRRRDRRAHHFDDIGIDPLGSHFDLGRQRRDIDGGVGERQERRADRRGLDRRQVALHVDDDFGAALRIDLAERLEDAVGAGGVIRRGHHRAAAGLIHSRGDFRRVGRDHDRADIGGLRAAQDMHDHRLAGDIGKRFAREPGRGHAGGNQDENIGHRAGGCLYGLQDTGQTG